MHPNPTSPYAELVGDVGVEFVEREVSPAGGGFALGGDLPGDPAVAGVVTADCEIHDCHAEHSLDGDEINITIIIKGTKS